MEKPSANPNEDFQLKFSIDKWEREKDIKTNKTVIKYFVDISSDISNKKWTVTRTLENFKALIDNLTKQCINIATPPKLFGLKESTQTLTQIGKDFENYVKLLLTRADVFNSQVIGEFFEIANHFDKIQTFLPELKYQITDIKLQVTDMYYNEEEKLLFVTCGKKYRKNFLEKNSVFSKLTGFFKKSNEGEILVFKIGKTMYQKLFSLETKSEISSFAFYKNDLLPNKIVIVGYFDGTIDIFDVNYNPEQIVVSSSLLKLRTSVLVSDKNRSIISFGMNFSTKYIYVACEKENDITVCFSDCKEKIKTIKASDVALAGFAFNYDNIKNINKYISIDIDGKIMIGVIDDENSIINLQTVILEQLTSISLFKINFKLNQFLLGDIYGNFRMFRIEDKNDKINLYKTFSISLENHNKSFNELVHIAHPYEIRDAIYNHKKREIYFVLPSGIIQVFSHFTTSAECAIENNEESLNKICMNDDFTIMFCGGVSKNVNLLGMPKYFLSEMTRKSQEDNSRIIFKRKEELLTNEIEKGYPKTPEEIILKKEPMIKVNSIMIRQDDNEEHYPGFVSMKI